MTWNKKAMAAEDLNNGGSRADPSFWKKIPDEVAFNHVNFGIRMTTAVGDNQKHKKSGKLVRVSNGSCKRSRLAKLDISVSESVAEITKVPKQKNISKRRENRNGKPPKSRGDTFYLKNGLVSFTAAAGGNNFTGAYGSKLDLFDVTKHIDDPSLIELLDGSYECPIYSKDKGKQVKTSNEDLLLSVRKAWSILELQKHAPNKKIGEFDSSSAELSCSGSSSANRCDTGNGDVPTAECTSSLEVHESNKNISFSMAVVNLPLSQPKDVLNCLSLPPSKDLDALLLDATKPGSSSRNNSDLRLGKLGSWRSGLPPFSWSQSSSVQSKSVSDAVRSTTLRNSCQCRWVKVENSVNYPNDSPRFAVDLESLTYDRSLVPTLTQEMALPQTENAPSASFIIATNQIENSSALCSTSHYGPDEHPPGILGAAQTLYAIASSAMQNPNGTSKWQNKPSEKRLPKMYKSKTKNRESGYKFIEPKSTAGSNSIHNADFRVRSKKLKLSVDVRSEKINGAYSSKKSHILQRSCIMPPPSSRVTDSACGSQLKLR